MPIFFTLYYVTRRQWRNQVILCASLLFYAVGAGSTVFVLLVSVGVHPGSGDPALAANLLERIEADKAGRPKAKATGGSGPGSENIASDRLEDAIKAGATRSRRVGG